MAQKREQELRSKTDMSVNADSTSEQWCGLGHFLFLLAKLLSIT